MNEFYVIQVEEDGKFSGALCVDLSSGGYPYFAESPIEAHKFRKLHDAMRYFKNFDDGAVDYLHRYNAFTMEIRMAAKLNTLKPNAVFKVYLIKVSLQSWRESITATVMEEREITVDMNTMLLHISNPRSAS